MLKNRSKTSQQKRTVCKISGRKTKQSLRRRRYITRLLPATLEPITSPTVLRVHLNSTPLLSASEPRFATDLRAAPKYTADDTPNDRVSQSLALLKRNQEGASKQKGCACRIIKLSISLACCREMGDGHRTLQPLPRLVQMYLVREKARALASTDTPRWTS